MIITILTEFVHDFTILTGQKILALSCAFFLLFYRRSKKFIIIIILLLN